MRARGVLPRAPAEQARCRVAASQSSPLVTEWPASEKANLEVLLRDGRRRGRLLGLQHAPAARVPRARRIPAGQRTTPATDSLEINDADELYAKLPLGAASLEGELKRSGKLSVKTMVAGPAAARRRGVTDVPQRGRLRAGHPPLDRRCRWARSR